MLRFCHAKKANVFPVFSGTVPYVLGQAVQAAVHLLSEHQVVIQLLVLPHCILGGEGPHIGVIKVCSLEKAPPSLANSRLNLKKV